MGLTQRLDQARTAFERGDIDTAARLHDPAQVAHDAAQPTHIIGGKYLGDFVYGGLDGIITTFAVVSGVAGARLDADIILILGIANLLADGFSMATGAYLSTKSDREFYAREASRQQWEIEHFPEGQREELRQLYRQQGYADDEAEQLVALTTSDDTRWVRAMLIEEDGLLEDTSRPIYSSIATFAAFVLAGSIPLLVYLLGLMVPIAPETAFPVSIALSGLALFGLGAAKVLVTRLSALRSGLEMLLVGGLAATVAYIVGALLQGLGG
jgi:VIT1/CCC1 family predicted Fe2+/Mn2+ transporter